MKLAVPIDRSPDKVKAARVAAGLTQAEAASIAGVASRERWTEYESGTRQIDPVRFEYFLLLTDGHPAYRLAKRRLS